MSRNDRNYQDNKKTSMILKEENDFSRLYKSEAVMNSRTHMRKEAILEAPERGLAGTASLSSYPYKNERRWYLYDRSFGQEALLKTYGKDKPAPEDVETWLKQELLERAKGRPYAQEQFARPLQETWHSLSTADLNLAELERGAPTPNIPDPAARLTTADVNRLLPAGVVVHRDRLKILAPSAKEVSLGAYRLITIRCLDGTIPLNFAYVYKGELIQILN